ncbi:hypothetical protein M0811_10885 [Anaeramoeba ignava]|uniref:THH1/TOM1/TOM3 domain-containing protein n=1 Tax=Anaeramoeba ignava TaxID=1746090 RepID=A0A9Q0LCW8_ANAIG|nr:hypothetical protein M0811_10885 [Anaeramoeba ignava]
MQTESQALFIAVSIIYFIFFIIALIRWILLLKRTKQLLHQKIFFFLIWLFCLARFITLFLFGIPKIYSNYLLRLDQFLGIETNLLITAFLLIIFALNQIRIKIFSENYDNEKKKKMILFFIIFDIILISFHVFLVFDNFSISRWFLCLIFLFLSIGFLIYSVKLTKNSEDQKKSKKFSQTFLICTICFLIRIPILIFFEVKRKSITELELEIIDIIDILFTELIPVSLITFYIFEIPIKSALMENLELLRHNF